MPVRLPLWDDERTVIVDDDLAPALSKLRWRVGSSSRRPGNPRPYAYLPKDQRPDGARTITLARIIAGARRGQMVQHLNGDTLDCRRDNLRLVSAHRHTERYLAGRPATLPQDIRHPLTVPTRFDWREPYV